VLRMCEAFIGHVAAHLVQEEFMGN
jgi:hypothetical protein